MSSGKKQEGHLEPAAPDVEPKCLRCGYSLRMLEQSRCPECGRTFDWDEVIVVAKYGVAISLFEYKWRSRPMISLVNTLALTLVPWRLWSRTPLRLEPRIGPLLVLIPLTYIIYIALAFARYYMWFCFLQPSAPITGVNLFWDHSTWVDVEFELYLPSLFAVLFLLVIQLFRRTITRHQIQQRDILRVIVLTWIGVLMLRSLIEIACDFPYLVMRWYNGWYNGWRIPHPDYLVTAAAGLLLLMSLGFAFGGYLKVRRGWLWAFILIGFTSILIAALVLVISIYSYGSWENPMAYMLQTWGSGGW